jgi:hypothetical protein
MQSMEKTMAKPTNKTPNVGDLNDYVTLEANLARANETIEKQRVHIRALERELVSLIRVSEDDIAWLRAYVTARDDSARLRKDDLRAAKGFNSVGTHHQTPLRVIEVTRAPLRVPMVAQMNWTRSGCTRRVCKR